MTDRFTLNEIASVCGEVIKDHRKELVGHVNRVATLFDAKLKTLERRVEKQRERGWGLHDRLSYLEGEVKRLRSRR